jgi:hypothetical protein
VRRQRRARGAPPHLSPGATIGPIDVPTPDRQPDAEDPVSLVERREPLLRAALAIAAGVVYLLAGPGQQGNDPFGPLAAALLAGRLSIPDPMPWLESIPAPDGGWYAPLAPGPALVLLPVVAVAGPDLVDSGAVSAIAGALAVWLGWGFVRRVGASAEQAAALTVALAFGTQLTWVATSGGPHNVEHAVSLAAMFGALGLGLGGRAPVAAGLLWSLAVACRVPIALALPVFAWLYQRRTALFAAGAAPLAVLLAGYNVLRFGSPFDFGLTRIMGGDPPASVLDEPWYEHGIFSIHYLPRGLHTMLLRSFDLVADMPWFRPNWTGTSLLLTTPALLWLWRARDRALLVPWLTVALILAPDLLHGVSGFAQFGYRFICDVLPILWWLLAWVVVHRGLTLGLRIALVAGIFVHVYGLVTIWGLGFVAY